MADTTRRQLDIGKAAHERIQARYDELIREIEAVQSELNVSHDYLVTLEQQLKMFEEEDYRIAGLLHPIRRCPEDILKLIFECAAHDQENQLFDVSTTLSHVCRRWRAIALRISSLWTQIDVSMRRDDLKALRSFMKRTKVRVGTTPVNIQIKPYPQDEYFTQNFVNYMGLHYFTTIASLRYQLTSQRDILLLLEPPFSAETANVKQLSIEPRKGRDQMTEWGLVRLLETFPNIEFIQLTGLGIINFDGLDGLPSFRRLHIAETLTLGLSWYLGRHQHLQELSLKSVDIDAEPFIQDIVMPELKVLVVEHSFTFPWDRMSAPLLGVVETDDEDDGARAFLCRHPSIHRLHYPVEISVPEFKEIAKAMVNLNSLLLISCFEGLFREIDPDIPFPPFPKLKTLELDTSFFIDLSLEDFEQLMRLRCLPQQSSDKTKSETVSLLSIHLPRGELDLAPWRRSSLLDHVQQSVKENGIKCTFTLEMPK